MSLQQSNFALTKAQNPRVKQFAEFEVGEQNHDDVPKGRVISQDPRSGEGRKGDTIRLVVSKGPVMVAVPTVAGQGEAAATAALKAKGFQVKVVHATPEWLRDDKVKAASPAQGTMAKQGSTVTLWVI